MIESSLGSSRRTWSEMVAVTRTLIELYEGNQLGYVLRWLSTFVRNPSIKRRYLELASYSNIVRFVVDRVATNGYVPCRVIMLDRATNQPDPVAQAIWDEIADCWMSGTFSGFVQTTARLTELLRVETAGVEWDPWNSKIALGAYSAADLKVEYVEQNTNKLEPDLYVFTDRYTGAEQSVYDFSSHADGASGVVRQRDGKTVQVSTIDPNTGRSLNPFVAFRTFDGSEYYPWDGQEELIHAQQEVNRLVTRLSVLAEMGTNKILVLSGSGWTDQEGNIQAIPLDITQAIKEPEGKIGEDSSKPKMRWDGPQVIQELDAVNKLIHSKIIQVATQFRISPGSITSSNDPASGFSAQISEFALAEKHSGTRDVFRANLGRLVRNIMLTWNQYGAVGARASMAFSDTCRPHVYIPDYMGAASVSQHADADMKLVQTGIKRKLALIMKWEPGIPIQTAYEMADEGATGDSQEDKPLDAGQISALQGIAASVAAGTLSRDAGEALIKLALPWAEDSTIEALLTPPPDAEDPAEAPETPGEVPDAEDMAEGPETETAGISDPGMPEPVAVSDGENPASAMPMEMQNG